MGSAEISALLRQHFGNEIIIEEQQSDGLMPYVVVAGEKIVEICYYLYTSPHTYFDMLSCITGIDNGPSNNTMDVVYNLYSIPYNFKYCIKVVLRRNAEAEPGPSIDSVSHIWRTANWHEREIYDMFGIHFNNHPDLRRILLPADWEGHPLRKDYNQQEYYHHIKTNAEPSSSSSL